MSQRYVGTPIERLDGRDKVSGRETYTFDLHVPGMAVGAFLGSPYPHARIVSIDTSAAERLPGVYCVLTQDDLTRGDLDPYYGPIIRDQPILAIGKATFVGEPVAAVAAVDEETAQEALELIQVEYEELPAVLSARAGLASGAPCVHERESEVISKSGVKSVRPDIERNICSLSELQHGDPDAAFARCDFVFEDTYSTPATHGLPMEPHSCLAEVSRTGQITIHAATQSPFNTRAELARIFKVPLNQVRVLVTTLGGGFGSRPFGKVETLSVALARKAGVPVKVTLSSQQVFTNTVTRHPCEATVKFGVNADGRLVAAELRADWDSGAYAEVSPRVTQKAAYAGLGPYFSVENVRITSTAVYTNKVPAGAFRGYGQGQIAWAVESHMDTVARKLGLDPLEFRLRNFDPDGRYFSGQAALAASARACLQAAAEQVGWRSEPDGQSPAGDRPGVSRRRGQGLSLAVKSTRMPTMSQAEVKLHADGSVTVECATVEMGQGTITALAQIAADRLQIPLEQIRMARIDTDHTPFDEGTGSSRSVYMMGLAVTSAADNLLEKLRRIAANLFEADLADVQYADGRFSVVGSPTVGATLAEVLRHHTGIGGGSLSGDGLTHTGLTHGEVWKNHSVASPFWTVAAAAAEVEVDPDTGQLNVLKYVIVGDAGKAINPLGCAGQLEGAALQSLGHALQEELFWDDGQPVNFSLLDYPVPSFEQLPDLRSVVLEQPDEHGPFGAKGFGEVSVTLAGPAIGNAVYAATGVRLHRLPLNAERVWSELTRAGAGDGS